MHAALSQEREHKSCSLKQKRKWRAFFCARKSLFVDSNIAREYSFLFLPSHLAKRRGIICIETRSVRMVTDV
jgi:hypothetical protein